MAALRNIKIMIKFLILTFLIIFAAVFMSGCGDTEAKVENFMKIADDFVGERIVTIDFGKDFAKEKDKQKIIENVIKEDCPPVMSCRSEVLEGHYRCIFVVSFSSVEDYKIKVASIIGNQIAVAFGYTDSVLAKGTYYKEDYDGIELVSWLADSLYQKGYNDIALRFNPNSNIVKYNGEILNSKSSVLDTSTVKGENVHGITIDTVNHKNGSYDRTMILSVSSSSYNKLGASLKNLMESRTGEDAKKKVWSESNGYMNFTVKYENIDIDRMEEYTRLFLDNRNASIYYGDQNQSSTPLAEQFVFEEKINVMSMVSDNADKNVEVSYNYTLPEETTHGQGVELSGGEWKTSGNWAKNTYSIKDSSGVYDIRIPDGMQYTIKGINITLTSLENDIFKREVDLIYDRNTGEKGVNYAYRFLTGKGITASRESTQEGIICRITQRGSSSEINNAVSSVFGSGNYFECSRHTNNLSVVTDIKVADNVNINHMLTGANTNIPINYTVKSESTEYITDAKTLNNDDNTAIKTKRQSDDSYCALIENGSFRVYYEATVPFINGIFMYIAMSGAVLIIFTLVIIFLLRYNRRMDRKEIITVISEKSSKENLENTALIEEKIYSDDDDL